MDQKNISRLMVLIQDPDSEKSKDLDCGKPRSPDSEQSNDSHTEKPKDFKGNASARSTPASPETISSLFCTRSNFQCSVVYLSQELQNLGFRYKLIEANGEKLNLVALVNSCWNVIQLYHAAIKDGNMLHDSRRRDVADINHLQGSVRELKSIIEDKDRLLQDAQEKERQVNSMNKALASKLKSEKDEVRRLNSILQQREIQHQHENRKKELEMNKLQDRLHRLVSGDRGTEARMSTLTMSGSLNRSDRARGRWRTDNVSIKQEEELYRRVLGQYESWVGQLTEEGDLLKECLASVSGKVSKLAGKCANSQIFSIAQEKDFLNDSLACSVLSSDSLEEEPLFSLNFISVRDRIQKTLEDNLQLLSQVLENKGVLNDTEVKEGEARCPNDIDSHNQKLCSDVDASFEKNFDQLADSLCVEKEAEIKDQMKQLSDTRKKLQAERETFAAAAVRLNKEKAAFEAEKVELLRHQFLEELPPILNTSKDPFTPNTSMESPLNRSLSDLYGDSPRNITAIPTLTSPIGSVTHTTQPVTLGLTRLPRHHRESKLGTPRSAVGRKSEPSTRNSSSSRSAEMRFLHESSRAKTLERPTRSTCPAHLLTDREGVGSSSHSLSRLAKKSYLLSLPSTTSLSQSINCPPLEAKGSIFSGRHSAEFARGISPPPPPLVLSPQRHSHPRASIVRSATSAEPEGVCCEECFSCDSGFYYDQDDYDALSSTCSYLKDVQTNSRLNALENSLTNLLEQINAKESNPPSEDVGSPPSGGLSDPSEDSRRNDDVESEMGNALNRSVSKPRKSSFSILSNKPSGGHPQHAFSASGPSPSSPRPTLLPDYGRRHSRLSSAPGSLGTSRKSSRDRRTGEDYLKRIQNNIAKWYWKQ